ncbi:MAG: hypothetical protein JST68_31035 [Bacteroidetes bacterium]|nr:hypothetical protein [Bacteroidota bacterium]
MLVLCLSGCRRTLLSASFAGKMTDRYFKLKKGNRFVRYERILGLTKVDRESGYYSISNDTIYLFYFKTDTPGSAGRAYLDKVKKTITFYDKEEYSPVFDISFDRRSRSASKP